MGLLFHHTRNGTASTFEVGEEGLGGAESQEHVKTDGDVIGIVSDIETDNLAVFGIIVVVLHIRKFEAAIFNAVIGLDAGPRCSRWEML